MFHSSSSHRRRDSRRIEGCLDKQMDFLKWQWENNCRWLMWIGSQYKGSSLFHMCGNVVKKDKQLSINQNYRPRTKEACRTTWIHWKALWVCIRSYLKKIQMTRKLICLFFFPNIILMNRKLKMALVPRKRSPSQFKIAFSFHFPIFLYSHIGEQILQFSARCQLVDDFVWKVVV
jgi:hypothetical protein